MKSWIKNVNHLAPLGLSIVLSFSLAACGTKANEPKVQAEQASEKTETESSKKNPVSGNPAEPEDKDKKSTKQKTEQKKQEETILKLQADLKATQESLKNEKEKVKKGIESLEKAQKNLKVAEETLKKLKEQGSAKEGTSEEITFALKAQKQAEADLKIKTTEAEDAKKKLAEAKKTISTLTDALADANKKLIAEEEKNKASPKQAPSPENTSAAPKPFPSEYAQCTDGAIQGKHSGEYQIHTFQSNIHIAVESIKDLHPNNNTFGGAAEASILTRILDLYPTAQYASNAAMFESDGGLSGLLKVDGVTRNKIDFLPHQGQNFGKENSILFHYWAGKRVNSDADHIEIQPLDPNKPLKWRMVTREWFGKQLQLSTYMATHPGETINLNDDFFSADQIDFALQSGPALIRNSDAELLSADHEGNGGQNYNMPDSGSKTLSGIDANGNLVMIDVVGPIGPLCIARYFKAEHGITDLLTRDAFRIGGSVTFKKDGTASIYNHSSDTTHVIVLYGDSNP